MCGLASPLTNRQPESEHARLIALTMAIAALGVTSVIVGLVGAMAISADTVQFIEVKKERGTSQTKSLDTKCGCNEIHLFSFVVFTLSLSSPLTSLSVVFVCFSKSSVLNAGDLFT